MIFPVRYALMFCRYSSDLAKLTRFLKGCDCIVNDGIGFMTSPTEAIYGTPNEQGSEQDTTNNPFQCSVDKVIDDIEGTNTIQTYGIARTAQFRI